MRRKALGRILWNSWNQNIHFFSPHFWSRFTSWTKVLGSPTKNCGVKFYQCPWTTCHTDHWVPYSPPEIPEPAWLLSVLALPIPCCLASSICPDLSMPPFYHLQNEDDHDSIYLIRQLWGWNVRKGLLLWTVLFLDHELYLSSVSWTDPSVLGFCFKLMSSFHQGQQWKPQLGFFYKHSSQKLLGFGIQMQLSFLSPELLFFSKLK